MKTFAVAGAKVVPYQGEMHRAIDGPEFYEIVGRPDLAESYRRNRRRARIYAFGGLGAALGGIVMFAIGHANENGIGDQVLEYGGLALVVGGLGVSLYGFYLDVNPDPTSKQERYDLAAEYNAKLRKKYGLPVSSRAPRHHAEVAVAPYLVGDSAGLVLSGRF